MVNIPVRALRTPYKFLARPKQKRINDVKLLPVVYTLLTFCWCNFNYMLWISTISCSHSPWVFVSWTFGSLFYAVQNMLCLWKDKLFFRCWIRIFLEMRVLQPFSTSSELQWWSISVLLCHRHKINFSFYRVFRL